jgi:hypothetical protein
LRGSGTAAKVEHLHTGLVYSGLGDRFIAEIIRRRAIIQDALRVMSMWICLYVEGSSLYRRVAGLSARSMTRR